MPVNCPQKWGVNMAWRRPPSFLQPITCPLKGEFVVCSEKGKKERRTDDGRANRRRKGRGFRPSVRPASLMAVSVTLTDWRALNCPFQSIQCHRVREREWRQPKCAWVCHPPTPPCVHSALKTCKSGRLSLLMSLVYTDTHVFVMTRTCIVR